MILVMPAGSGNPLAESSLRQLSISCKALFFKRQGAQEAPSPIESVESSKARKFIWANAFGLNICPQQEVMSAQHPHEIGICKGYSQFRLCPFTIMAKKG